MKKAERCIRTCTKKAISATATKVADPMLAKSQRGPIWAAAQVEAGTITTDATAFPA